MNRNKKKRRKGKIYKTMIRPVTVYGAVMWKLRQTEESKLERENVEINNGYNTQIA